MSNASDPSQPNDANNVAAAAAVAFVNNDEDVIGSNAAEREGLPEVSASDPDLDAFFIRFNHYSVSFKQKLLSLGVTFRALKVMNKESIMKFADVDRTLTADIILLIQDLETYKSEMSENTSSLATAPLKRNVKRTPSTASEGTMGVSAIASAIGGWMTDEGNFNFALAWIVCLVLTVAFIVAGSVVDTLKCPASCNISQTVILGFDTVEKCSCDPFDDKKGQWCGSDGNAVTLECETDEVLTAVQLAMIVIGICIAVVSFCLLIMYFVRVFELSYFDALARGFVFVWILLAVSGLSCVLILAVGSIFWPFGVYIVNKDESNNFKGPYTDLRNNKTHWHLLTCILKKHEFRFYGIWSVMLFVTWFITGIFYPCSLSDSCDKAVIVIQVGEWVALVGALFFIDYLIVAIGLKKVCQVKWPKALVLGIAMTCIMLALGVPIVVLWLFLRVASKVLSRC